MDSYEFGYKRELRIVSSNLGCFSRIYLLISQVTGSMLKILRLRKVLAGKDFYQLRQVRRKTICLGNRYANWTFCPEELTEDSIVFSAGAGRDISFDLELIDRFGSSVFLFDPTPESIEWIGKMRLPEQLRFYQFGLSNMDGYMDFLPAGGPDHVSLKIIRDKWQDKDRQRLQVQKLDTIVHNLGIAKIDLLKTDIEGEEYSIIDDIISSPVEINQILMEFHHRFEGHSVADTKNAIRKLNTAGYFIFHVSPNGEEFSFIKVKR